MYNRLYKYLKERNILYGNSSVQSTCSTNDDAAQLVDKIFGSYEKSSSL